MTRAIHRRFLVALGDGGTHDMADRVLKEFYLILNQELLGRQEVGELFGVTGQAIDMRLARGYNGEPFEPPVGHIRAGSVWFRSQILERYPEVGDDVAREAS